MGQEVGALPSTGSKHPRWIKLEEAEFRSSFAQAQTRRVATVKSRLLHTSSDSQRSKAEFQGRFSLGGGNEWRVGGSLCPAHGHIPEVEPIPSFLKWPEGSQCISHKNNYNNIQFCTGFFSLQGTVTSAITGVPLKDPER